MKRTTVFLVDDHAIMRMGLASLLATCPEIKVLGDGGDEPETIDRILGLNPDVVIMDLVMPRLDGAAATSRLCAAAPDTRVLILTTFGTSDELRRALDAGAVGALVKDSAHGQLIGAIRHAASGDLTISPEIKRQLKASEQKPELTSRQTEILTYVAKGLNNREIAELIGIGPDCVKAHLKTAFARLGAASRSEAVAIALRKGLLRT